MKVKLNPRDSVMTNAGRLASVGGGGTDCSAPLAQLNKAKSARATWSSSFRTTSRGWTLVADVERGRCASGKVFKSRNPSARLVCVDIQPYGTTQAHEREDILNIGGFSDQIFKVVSGFAAGEAGCKPLGRRDQAVEW